jgi:hypothetical protein
MEFSALCGSWLVPFEFRGLIHIQAHPSKEGWLDAGQSR